MKEKDGSLFEHNGKTYKLVKQPKEGKSCGEFCSLNNFGCEKLCVKAYNELDNPDFGLIEAVFVEVDESGNKETDMKENEKDKVQSQPKQEWSEEDESKFKFLHHLLEQNLEPHGSYSFSDVKELGYVKKQEALDMFKSLKDRMTWRPTEEQMKALKNMLHPDVYYYELLKSLYNDLKKL